MKFKLYKSGILPLLMANLIIFLLLPAGTLIAQNDTLTTSDPPVVKKPKPVKNSFESVWIIDNQTVLVPIKGTLEMDIMHRFGTIENGYEDFWGFFAPSSIRLGASYAPVNKLYLGVGVSRFTKTTIPYAETPGSVNGPLWDGSLKYSIITQTPGKYPVSVSYYANAAFNTKKDTAKDIYQHNSDRLSFFHQVLIARKINDKLTLQIAPSLSHQNVVNGYYTQLDSANLKVHPEMQHNHFAIAFSARYKLTNVTSVMVNYDQPLTKHTLNNPFPSLSFGVEFNTSSHSFQLFFTNFYYLTPQTNNLYNSNAPFSKTQQYYTKNETPGGPPVLNEKKFEGGKFLIGFNITRLWNY